jgi:hypothetical protein
MENNIIKAIEMNSSCIISSSPFYNVATRI